LAIRHSLQASRRADIYTTWRDVTYLRVLITLICGIRKLVFCRSGWWFPRQSFRLALRDFPILYDEEARA